MPDHRLPDTTRTARLQTLLDRWIVEFPRVVAIDPLRARHHAEAIADLRVLIARLDTPVMPVRRAARPVERAIR